MMIEMGDKSKTRIFFIQMFATSPYKTKKLVVELKGMKYRKHAGKNPLKCRAFRSVIGVVHLHFVT